MNEYTRSYKDTHCLIWFDLVWFNWIWIWIWIGSCTAFDGDRDDFACIKGESESVAGMVRYVFR
jgi:hypothetical protein